jgi:hypothetical protein
MQMKHTSLLALVVCMVTLCSLQPVKAQLPIRIKIPRTAKAEKSKQEPPGTEEGGPTQSHDAATATQPETRPASSAAKRSYEDLVPTKTPIFVKDSLYIQAKTHNSYWKFPNLQNYSSWVPIVAFNVFFNRSHDLNYAVEYFNPDGSSWFSEKLAISHFRDDVYGAAEGDGTDRLDSRHNSNVKTAEMLDKKSSAAVGTYGIKISNTETGEIVFQGKFKVGKFLRPFQSGNDFEFYVEHDWLLPIGYVGFDQNIGVDGIRPLEISIWLKDKIERNELEARLFYKGQQIATTTNRDGMVSTADAEERTTEYSMNSAALHDWKLWHFEWMKTFLYGNGISSNLDNFPDAFYADNNPGEYTVKIYRKGAQVRELKFIIAPDGKLVDGGYARPIFLTRYRVIVPVKIMGPEKWDPTSFRTDAFYGNPLTGFTAQ